MRIFVSGTWGEAKAAPYAAQGILLGRRIAEAGLDLSCGPGTGIARHVIDGYRAVEGRGSVRYYLPLQSEMEAVGEEVAPGADEIVQTELDYPMRNVLQVKESDGLFALTGGDGTLEEIIPAVVDYEIPVQIIDGAGTAAAAIHALLEIYPGWSDYVEFGATVEECFDGWLARVTARGTLHPS